MNKVMLMGRLTRDPEVRYGGQGEPVAIAKYSLAVNRQFKRDNEPDVDFINCKALGKKGEFAEKYFKKGQMIAVCGRLQISNYEDQSGQKKTWTEVMVEDQYFAESKASFESRMKNEGTPGEPEYTPDPEGFMPIEESVDDDDLPF
jgi:single-strand DNA-binding protein